MNTKTQNKAIAKDSALTGLPTLSPDDMPTPAQRKRWSQDYAKAQGGALKMVKAVNEAQGKPELSDFSPEHTCLNEERIERKMETLERVILGRPTSYADDKEYIPTPQDHIRDLHDAATRFEDRAKRAEAHAQALADALREQAHDVADVMLWLKCPESTVAEKFAGIEAVLGRNREPRKSALAAWEAAQ